MIGIKNVTMEVLQITQVKGRITIQLSAKLQDGTQATVAMQVDGEPGRRMSPDDVLPGDLMEVSIISKLFSEK